MVNDKHVKPSISCVCLGKSTRIHVCIAKELTSWLTINSLLTTFNIWIFISYLCFSNVVIGHESLLFVFVICIYHICAKGHEH